MNKGKVDNKLKVGLGKKRKATTSSEGAGQKTIKTEPKLDCGETKVEESISQRKRFILEKRIYYGEEEVDVKIEDGELLYQDTLKILHKNILPEEQNDVPIVKDLIKNSQGCDNRNIKEIKWKGEGKWPNEKMHNDLIMLRGKKKNNQTEPSTQHEKFQCDKDSDGELAQLTLRIHHQNIIPEEQNDVPAISDRILNTQGCENSDIKEVRWNGEGKWPNSKMYNTNIIRRGKKKKSKKINEKWIYTKILDNGLDKDFMEHCMKVEVLDTLEAKRECNELYEKLLYNTIPYHSGTIKEGISTNEIDKVDTSANEMDIEDEHNTSRNKQSNENIETVVSSPNKINKGQNKPNNMIIKKEILDIMEINTGISQNLNINKINISNDKIDAIVSRPNEKDKTDGEIKNMNTHIEPLERHEITPKIEYSSPSKLDENIYLYESNNTTIYKEYSDKNEIDTALVQCIFSSPKQMDKHVQCNKHDNFSWIQNDIIEELLNIEKLEKVSLKNKIKSVLKEKEDIELVNVGLEDRTRLLESKNKEYRSTVDRIHEKNMKFENEIHRLLLDVANKDVSIYKLETKNQEVSNEKNKLLLNNLELQNKSKRIEDDIKESKKILSSRHSKVTELSGQNQVLRNEVKQLKEIMSKYQHEDDRPQKVCDEKEEIEGKNQELGEKYQELLKENERLFVRNVELINKTSVLEDDIKESKSNLEKSQKLVNVKNGLEAEKCEKLELQNKDLKNEIIVIKEIMTKLQKENDMLQKGLDKNKQLKAENQEFKKKHQECLKENERLLFDNEELNNKIRMLENDNKSEEELQNKIRLLETDKKEYKSYIDKLEEKCRILVDNKSQQIGIEKERIYKLEQINYELKREVHNFNEKMKTLKSIELQNTNLKNENAVLAAINKKHSLKNLENEKERKKLEEENAVLAEKNKNLENVKEREKMDDEKAVLAEFKNLKNENAALAERNKKQSLNDLENEKQRKKLEDEKEVLADRNKKQSMRYLEKEKERKKLEHENAVLTERNKKQLIKDLESEKNLKLLEDKNANLNMKSTQQQSSIKTQEDKIKDQKEKMKKWMQKYDTVKKENEDLKNRKKIVELTKCKLDEEIQQQKMIIQKIEKREYFAKQREYELRISQDSFRYIKTVLCQFNLREETLNIINQQLKKISEQLDFETELVDSNGSSQEGSTGSSVSVSKYIQQSPASPDEGSYPSSLPSTTGGSGLKRSQQTPHKKSNIKNLINSSKISSHKQALSGRSSIGEKGKGSLALKLSLQNKKVNTSQNIAMDEMLDDIVKAIKEGGVFPVERLKHLDYNEFKDGLLENLRSAGCDINQSDMEKIYKKVVHTNF